MIRRYILNLHLYIGLALTMTILILSITGLYLNHQHDWFHKQNIHYLDPNYDLLVHQAISSAEQESRIVPGPVETAEKDGLFTIDEIESINYANHGLGYFYYVHLNDQKNSIVVITEKGEIAKSYSDPLLKKWMRGLHIELVNQFNFVWINDLTTIGIIFLTISGCILAWRILKAKYKRKEKRSSERSIVKVEE